MEGVDNVIKHIIGSIDKNEIDKSILSMLNLLKLLTLLVLGKKISTFLGNMH